MHIPEQTDPGLCPFFHNDIVTGIECNFPFGCEAQISIESNGLGDFTLRKSSFSVIEIISETKTPWNVEVNVNLRIIQQTLNYCFFLII